VHRALARALSVLRRLEGVLLGVLMLAMSFAYTANVLVRELAASYASRFAWIDEACLFGLAWMVFLGLGLALERGRHISMTSVLARLAPGLRRRTKLLIDLTGLVFSLYIAQTCFDVTLLVLKSGQVSPTLNVSTSWLYGPMPVGFVLLGLRYLLELTGVRDRRAIAADPALHI
jgi:C4-dicarboxylate transporter DctQ subunit